MATPKLCIDTTPLILDGKNLVLKDPSNLWVRSADPIGTIERRSVCGGKPPYTYESEDTSIASVDERGVVRSTGNGTTIISVKDAKDSLLSFEVRSSNTYKLGISPHDVNSIENAKSWIDSIGGTYLNSRDPIHVRLLNNLCNICYRYGPIRPYQAFYTGLYHPSPEFGTYATYRYHEGPNSYGAGWAYGRNQPEGANLPVIYIISEAN